MDTKAATIKVGKRLFHISKTTRLIKDDKPMELSEELVGQRIGGSYIATSDGTLEVGVTGVSGCDEYSNAWPGSAANQVRFPSRAGFQTIVVWRCGE